MSADLATKLAEYGIDYTDAMDRMGGNGDLYKKLALKYLDDGNYEALVAAMDVADYDDAYKAAHSLKGVAGNLSFNKLFELASTVSGALFQGEYQAVEPLMPALKEANEKVIEGLTKWSDEAL